MFQQKLPQTLNKMLLHSVQAITDHVLLIGKVLVEAAPWNVGSGNDAVDGYIVETDPGTFLPAGVHQPQPFFLRQAKKCTGWHMRPPL